MSMPVPQQHVEEVAAQSAGGKPLPRGFTVWFTGLSGAGKSTLAVALHEAVAARGYNVELLDGDVIRTSLCKGLGFSKEDRDTNIRRVGFVANLISRNNAAAITACISPYRSLRQEIRDSIQDFIEVYVECPISVCERRDVKGLYAKARAGEIKGFTGIDDPYEEPEAAEVTVRTADESEAESLAKILRFLEEREYI